MTETKMEVLEQISQGLFSEEGRLAELIRAFLQPLMEEELERQLGAGRYERTDRRVGHRNGYKKRTIKTRVGEIRFSVPQPRAGGFTPSFLNRYQRSERALLVACAEMYFQGVSTRKVGEVLEAMCGFEVSAATVSQVAADLDERLAEFRARRLEAMEWPYLIVDARYEKVRQGRRVLSEAVLIVCGVNNEGRREVLDFRCADSESELCWKQVFLDLRQRGLQGVRLVVSDAHKGLTQAVRKVFPGASWQRCRTHFMREQLNKVSYRERKELAGDLKGIFAGQSQEFSMEVAMQVAEKWRSRKASVAKAIEEGVEDCLAYLAFPRDHWRRLGTTNMLERLNRELKRRTRVVGIFPNRGSCERLIGAQLLEIHESWQIEPRCYLNMELLEKSEQA